MDKTEAEVIGILRRLAETHRPQIVKELVEAELDRRHRYATQGDDPLSKLKSYYEESRRVAEEKLAVFAEVSAEVEQALEQRWETDWFTLMDGKRALGEFVQSTYFRSTASFVDALGATLRDVPGVTPPGIDDLRERLYALIRKLGWSSHESRAVVRLTIGPGAGSSASRSRTL